MIKRLWRYLQTMFPVHRLIPVFLISFAVTLCTATRVNGQVLQFHPRLAAGALSFMFFGMLLRVMDEFKDYEIDQRLFPDRPLVTGMVNHHDLSVLGWSTVLALFLLNIWQGPLIFGTFLLCFGYTLLMFKFFFWHKVRESLVYALVTHNPVMLLFQCYIIAYHIQLSSGPVDYVRLLLVAVLFWLPWLTWELARKIRAPESEDEYETYSQVFGYRRACSIVIGLVLIIFGETAWVSQFYTYGILLLAGVGSASAFVTYRCVRFAFGPTPGKSPLRSVLEMYLPIFYATYAIVQLVH